MSDNDVIYRKQFDFQEKHSIEHAIMQLFNQINCSFQKNLYTPGLFINLSKALDTVDHKILITKLENYGVKGTNLQWFKRHLENRKQFIAHCIWKFFHFFLNISCGVPQGSILGPFLFLVYVNDFNKASEVLDPIMFADYTNVFCSHRNIKNPFGMVDG